MELTYRMAGKVMLPNVMMPKQEKMNLGRYAQMREDYLKANDRLLYYHLLTNCLLCSHLKEIEEQAKEMEERLVNQLEKDEGVTEELKRADLMTWVARMNSIRNRAREIVMSEIIMN